MMQTAAEAFQSGNTKQAIDIYTNLINNKESHQNEALLNRSSAYFSSGEYKLSLDDARLYLQTTEKPVIQGYIMFANGLIKTKAILSEQDRKLLSLGQESFPYHKKFIDTLKVVYQLQITENQEEYLEKIFQKLLSVPTLRKYMQEQSFLTKVEKMIKNPSLASALIKMDGRLADVQQIILMADE